MFVQESKKVFANVCFQRFAVGWVKPYNIAFSIFPVFNIFNIFSMLLISFSLYPQLARRCSYGAVSQNISFDDDNYDKRFSMDRGRCLVIDGG